jgi:transcription termination/antitermination protein NusG
MDNMGKQWYVLQVMTGKEIDVRAKVLSNLKGIQGDQPKALVPQRKITERKQGRVRQVIRTLFPSYVFLNVELDDHSYHMIRQVPYVIRLLGSSRPIPVPAQQMQPILRLCQLDELIDVSKISIGKTVEVLEGPLRGYAGDIVSIDKRKKRARIRFQILDETKEIDLGIEIVGSN